MNNQSTATAPSLNPVNFIVGLFVLTISLFGGVLLMQFLVLR